MTYGKFFIASILTGFVIISQARAQSQLPKFNPNVVDPGKYLSSSEEAAINLKIDELRLQNNIWSAVFVIRELEGESIEELAYRAFNEWGLGSRAENNGLLLVIAMDDRQSRFEVGSGLEGSLPDALVGRALDQQLRPMMRQGLYAQAIINTLAFVGQVGGGGSAAVSETSPAAPATLTHDFGSNVRVSITHEKVSSPYSFVLPAFVFGFIILLFTAPFFFAARKIRRRLRSGQFVQKDGFADTKGESSHKSIQRTVRIVNGQVVRDETLNQSITGVESVVSNSHTNRSINGQSKIITAAKFAEANRTSEGFQIIFGFLIFIASCAFLLISFGMGASFGASVFHLFCAGNSIYLLYGLYQRQKHRELSTSQEKYDHFLSCQFAVFKQPRVQSFVFLFLPAEYILAVYDKKMLAKFRNTALSCKKCEQPMERIDGQKALNFLSEKQLTEQKLASVQFDVWSCPVDGNAQFFHLKNITTDFVTCGSCMTESLRLEANKVIQESSTLFPGYGERQYKCHACGVEEAVSYIIAKKSKSSSSSIGASGSSSRSSSSGGGRSSGGGASSSW